MRLSYAVLLGVVLAAGGYAGWRYWDRKPEAPPPPPPVPVTAAPAVDGTVPVYLRGIGTARALNQVEIRPQVGGTLLSVPVREGDRVEKGATLAVIDPRPYQAALDKARAQRAQDAAQLANAQADYQRYASLARSDFASRQQVETQQAAVARLQGVIAADDAAIEEAEINLGYCVLRAPMDGRVGLRRVDPGNLVQPGGTGPGILSVVQDQPIAVVYTLPDSELPRVRQAMGRGKVPVFADSSDQGKELARGELLTTDNAVDAQSGTIGLKAQFDNPERTLTPGQFVAVRTQVDTAHGVVVPHEAVQHGQQGLFVFLVKPDGTADRRDVELLYDDGGKAVLSKGIAAGEQVVVSGHSRVGAGTRLAVRKPGEEQSPAGGGTGQGSPDQGQAGGQQRSARN